MRFISRSTRAVLALMALSLGCGPAFSDATPPEPGSADVGVSRATPPSSAADYTFALSSDPAVVVLRVAQVNPPRYERFFHLHGDGRVEMKEIAHRRVKRRYSTQLDYEEMEELVRRAIEHGLADYRHLGLTSLRTAETCRGGTVTDAGGTQFTLRLDSYARSGQPEGELENKIYVHNLNLQPRKCPGLAIEYEHLLAIEARIEPYWAKIMGEQR